MRRIPASPPQIPALPLEEAAKPLWSVMVPVYNCSRFLTECLNSILVQGFPEAGMQVEVVDDASTDTDVAALVQAIGKGRIRYHRQPQNVGSLRNFETCLNRAQGKLVHILHGDDKVRDGYYAAMNTLFQAYPEAGAAFCRYGCINETGQTLYEQSPEMQQEGILQNWLLKIAERQRIQYAAITVRREVFEKLGGFYALTYGEDWEMWARIARHFPVAYTPTILADYRKHPGSISGLKYLTGHYIEDLAQAMQLIQNHLPAHQRESVLNRSKKYYAYYAVKVAGQLWQRLHSKQVVQAQVARALHLHQAPRLYWKIAQVYFKIFLHTVWR